MTQIKCAKCEFINREGMERCTRCGTPLPRVRISAAPDAVAAPVQQGTDTVFRPGQVVAGRYTIIGIIGRGGMGCIYRVRDNVLQEDVALKTLLPQFLREKMIVDRFFNEARIARALSHPNIVRVHDIGTSNGMLYISMELVRGRSLRAMLEQIPAGQRLPARTTLHIIDELCAALEYAHHHTIHRDIKPENIMIGEDGSVKLMDFGISKLMDAQGLTSTAMVMGTPYYMSPEQQRNSANVDARADIYSVGVVLYEILTGNVPTGVPKPASQLMREVPPALDPIVAKCVDPNPKERYANVAELRAALRQIMSLLESGDEHERIAIEKKQKAEQRQRVVTTWILILAILLGSGFFLMKAENKRKADINSSQNPVTSETPTKPEGFSRFESLIPSLRVRAEKEAQKSERATKWLRTADAQWKHAQEMATQRDPLVAEEALVAAQLFYGITVCPPTMVLIPAGEVILDDGTARGRVYVDPFLIDIQEITNGEFLKFCTETQWRATSVLAMAPPDLPVANVTFYDAQAYAAWSGKAISLVRMLPTEAQWARAAYGEPTSPTDPKPSSIFPWGEQWESGAANLLDSSNAVPEIKPVGSCEKDTTLTGCRDMVGNVSEWTRTLFAALPYSSSDGRDDPAVPWFGVHLTVRGGSYRDVAPITLLIRRAIPYETSLDTIGFRCVAELPRRIEDFR